MYRILVAIMLVLFPKTVHSDALIKPVLGMEVTEDIFELQVLGDQLWVIGRENLYVIDDDEIVRKLSCDECSTVARLQGNVYVGTVEGIRVLDTNLNYLSRVTDDVLGSIAIHDIENIGERLWLSTNEGLYWYGHDRQFKQVQIRVIDEDVPAPANIVEITHANGVIWFTDDLGGRKGLGEAYKVTGISDYEIEVVRYERRKVLSVSRIGDQTFFGTIDGVMTEEYDSPCPGAEKTAVNSVADLDGKAVLLVKSKGVLKGTCADGFAEFSFGKKLSVKSVVKYRDDIWFGAEEGLYVLDRWRELVGTVKGGFLHFGKDVYFSIAEYNSCRSESRFTYDPDTLESVEICRAGSADSLEEMSWGSCLPLSGPQRFTSSGKNSEFYRYVDNLGNVSPILQFTKVVLPGFWIWLLIFLLLGIVGYGLRLLRKTEFDPLTGLLSRRSRTANRRVKRMFKRAVRSRCETCFVLLDLDNFGKINKEFGHDAGDEILRQVGEVLGANFRKGDFKFRWGGEEFLVVMIGLTESKCIQYAEKLRASLNSYLTYSHREKGEVVIKYSVSIGVTASVNDSWKETYKEATRRLGEAKRRGKNQVFPSVTLEESASELWIPR